MKKSIEEALTHRRSYYALSAKSDISDSELQEILEFALWNLPSAYNSQTTRLVLLLGDHHLKLWEIVKAALKKETSAETFIRTAQKIDDSFASGYGTVLFYEEDKIVKKLQESFPRYKDNFPLWSQHASAMHQLTVWTLLEEKGFGASLQHYNPLIDDEVRQAWGIPDTWKLVAQMPFGLPLQQPGPKDHLPLEERIRVFK